jgi:ArsR family transcriptional regulator
MAKHSLEYPQLDELNLLHAHICLALAEPKRIQILYALHEEPRYVSALAELLRTPQPTVSRHLKVLRERGLVLTKRIGPAVVYRLADDRIITVLNLMRQLLRDTLVRQAKVLE